MPQYIEVHSSFRERNKFPNPAQFEITHGREYYGPNNLIDPVSNESIVYPNPEIVDPIGFYEEYDFGEVGQLTEQTNLPFIYSSENLDDNVVILDELPIISSDFTTANLSIPLEFPRSVYPLSNISNYYIDDIIQNVSTGEERKIIRYEFDDSDNILQQGTTNSYFSINPSEITLLAKKKEDLFSQIPLSNIAGFYQGKYLRIISGSAEGEEQLIIQYYLDVNQFPTFVLEGPFENTISENDDFFIVSKFNYFATLETAFSSLPPVYPAFREPLSLTTGGSYNNIPLGNTIDSGNVLDTRTILLSNGNYGVAVLSSFAVFYYFSDDNGSFSNAIVVFSLSQGFSFEYFDLCLTDTFPTIVVNDDQGNGYFFRALDINGETWNNYEYFSVNAPVSGIRLIENLENTAIFFVSENADIICYENAGPSYNSINNNDTGEDGTIGDIFLIRQNILFPDNPNNGNLLLFYQNDGTDDGYIIQSNDNIGSSWGTPLLVYGTVNFTSVGPAIQPFVNPYSGYGLLYVNSSTNLGYISYLDIDTFTITNSHQFGATITNTRLFSRTTHSQNLNDNVEIIPDVSTGDTISSVLYDSGIQIFWTSTTSMIIQSGDIDPASSSSTLIYTFSNFTGDTFFTIDASTIIDIAESFSNTVPFIAYSFSNIYSSVLFPELNVAIGQYYRIRHSSSLYDTEDKGFLIDGSLNTFQLPLSANLDSSVIGKYIWIYNNNIEFVSSNFHMFNDFSKIIDFDTTSQEGTVAPAFSADLSSYITSLPQQKTLFNSFIGEILPYVSDSGFGGGSYSDAVYSITSNRTYLVPNNIAYYTNDFHYIDDTELFSYSTSFTNIFTYTGGCYDETNDLIFWTPYNDLNFYDYTPTEVLYVDCGSETVQSINLLTMTSNTTYLSMLLNNITDETISAGSWVNIAWSPDLKIFVAIRTGEIATSVNGFVWENYTAVAGTLTSLIWAPANVNFTPGKFVLVANTGQVYTSLNGISWSAQVAPANAWADVIWSVSFNRFVVIGTDNVMYSSNGISWTSGVIGAGTWTGLIESSTLIAAVSSAGVNVHGNSTDGGATWSTSALPAGSLQSIAFSSSLSLYVAVGNNEIRYSSNSTSWTSVVVAPSIFWRKVVWSSEFSVFIITGDVGTANSHILYSYNGTSFSFSNSQTALNSGFMSVVFSPFFYRFVFIGTTRVSTISPLRMRYAGKGAIINSRVYFAPFDSSFPVWHFIDLNTLAVIPYTHSTGLTISDAFFGCVYHTLLNRIYLVPHNNAQQTSWYFITSLGVVSSYVNGLTLNYLAPAAFAGGSYCSTNNSIYFAPYNLNTTSYASDSLYYINSSGSVGSFSHYAYFVSSAYVGSIYSESNDRIYFSPYYQAVETQYHYIDCATNSVIPYIHASESVETAYMNGDYDSNSGHLYFGYSRSTLFEDWFYVNAQDVGEIQLNYEILSVEDNYKKLQPFSTLLCESSACYSVELVSLSLPNIILFSGIGNRIAFYPYVYVEFTNITKPMSYQNVVSSNNPLANKILFYVPISNTVDPEGSSFVDLNSPMVHKIFFSPNDSFRFTVFLPNGEVFETDTDNTPPFEPNFLLQVSAVFAFERV